jgi:hypothetical protein
VSNKCLIFKLISQDFSRAGRYFYSAEKSTIESLKTGDGIGAGSMSLGSLPVEVGYLGSAS